jgi:hypothetical protein
MSEEFTTFNEFHDKVDAEIVLEHILHVYDERMVYSVEDILL